MKRDLRKSGRYFISMEGSAQGRHTSGGMTGGFEEIVANERIVITDSVVDENGRAISAREAGMTGQWPEQVYITSECEPAGKQASRFHLTQEGIPDEMQKECFKGWSESFDKLEEFCSSGKCYPFPLEVLRSGADT